MDKSAKGPDVKLIKEYLRSGEYTNASLREKTGISYAKLQEIKHKTRGVKMLRSSAKTAGAKAPKTVERAPKASKSSREPKSSEAVELILARADKAWAAIFLAQYACAEATRVIEDRTGKQDAELRKMTEQLSSRGEKMQEAAVRLRRTLDPEGRATRQR